MGFLCVMLKKQIYFTLLFFLISLCLASGSRQTTIFIIGDSTAANKVNPATNPERGWGMMLQGYFDDKIRVENHAVNGRSSKSFLDEGRWEKVAERIKPGDYVFIQFGHNDEKADPKRHTKPGTTFDANLERFINETRAHGGIPVLFNSVVRRNFYDNSIREADDELLRGTVYKEEKINSDTLIDTHGQYRERPRLIACKMRVTFIDANRITGDLEERMGPIGSRRLHMWYRPGEVPGIPDGRQDNTHYNIYGARIVAGLLAKEVGRLIPELRKRLVKYEYVVSDKGRGNYMDLKTAIDAIPLHAEEKIYILDGSWNISKDILKDKHIQPVVYPGASVEKND